MSVVRKHVYQISDEDAKEMVVVADSMEEAIGAFVEIWPDATIRSCKLLHSDVRIV